MIGAARIGRRFRFHSNNNPELSNIPVHASGIQPDGKLSCDTLPEVAGAVVPTVTVTVWLPLPVIFTEEVDNVHVGAGVTVGVMLQLRLTVPVNDPDGATTKLNLALCPALIVCDVDCPDAGPKLKSAAGCTTNETELLFTTAPELP
jgi:hypothetical protein